MVDLILARPTGIFLVLIITVLGLAIACGAAATATPVPTQAAQATPTPASEAVGIAPTATAPPAVATSNTPIAPPTPTVPPAVSDNAKDTVRVVIPAEPDALSPWSTGSAETGSIVSYNWGEPPVWLNTTTLELGPTTGVLRWAQVAPDRWQFHLRPGVKFVNGEPWNAEAAAWNISHQGDPESGLSFGIHGPISGEVVDDLTVDVVCGHAKFEAGKTQICPVLPADISSIEFQAPQWWESSAPEVRERETVGFGPYKKVEYVPGQHIIAVEYEDYIPPGRADLPKPAIPNVRYVWRLETTVRAAMIRTGEADHTYLLNVEDIPLLPKSISVPQWEVEGFYIDTLWHPMLKQTKFRQALVHAINCQEITETIFSGATTCTPMPGVIGMPGITVKNGTYWEYNPDLARQLLKDVGYSGEEIRITGRSGRVPKQPEVYEAMAGYWEEVGINAKVEVAERSVWRSIRNCGVGNTMAVAGDITPENLANPPTNCKDTADSGHLIEFTPEWPTLDFGRPAGRLMNCFYFQSRVCDPELQDLLERARAASLDDGRPELLEQLANRMKEDVLFVGIFQAFEIHGLVPDLEFKPRPDQRLRVAEMYWK